MNSETFCTYYNQKECRSCKWIETSYEDQLQQKESLLRNALAFAPMLNLLPPVLSAQTGFRNKAKLSVTGTSEHAILGITGEDRIDEGHALLNCPIHHPRLNEVIQDLPQWIHDYNLIPYQIESRKGELKGVILFYSEGSDEMYLRFVLRSKECVSRLIKMLPAFQKKFSFVKTLSANLQPIPHAILEGPEEIFITSQTFIHHRLGNLTLNLAPQAFVQTNVTVATQLYETAARWISEIKPRQMVELFCGQGPFSFFAKDSAENITGIEINADAVKTANDTAKALGLDHLRFQCVDVAKAQDAFEAVHPDLVLVNPPRRGLSKEGIAMILKEKPEHFLYSSCSYESLGRDLKALSESYEIKQAQIFDLFPHTGHFETLVLLSQSKPG